VHFYGLLQQVWAVIVLATGTAIAAEARPPGAFVQGEIGAIMVPAIVSIAIKLLRRRQKRHPDDPGATSGFGADESTGVDASSSTEGK